MTTNIQLFDFAPGFAVRSITKDSAPWFIAADVCSALGLLNVSQTLTAHVDAEDKAIHSIGLRGSAPLIVNESGLYALILRSKKPEAKKFQKWVTSVVLPALRTGGLYMLGQERPITDELTLRELTEQIAARQAKVSAALDALHASQVRAWSRHQEEKEARSDAFRFLKGKAPRVRL